jgi:hypothetical protein
MSNQKDSLGERKRCPIHGKGRRLSRRDIGEIRHSIDIANSNARRNGIKPKNAKITMFSCRCNCFHVNVE